MNNLGQYIDKRVEFDDHFHYTATVTRLCESGGFYGRDYQSDGSSIMDCEGLFPNPANITVLDSNPWIKFKDRMPTKQDGYPSYGGNARPSIIVRGLGIKYTANAFWDDGWIENNLDGEWKHFDEHQQSMQNKTPKYYRLLEIGEKVQTSDMHTNHGDLKSAKGFSGNAIAGTDFVIFRPVQVDEWIDYKEQKPDMSDDNLLWAVREDSKPTFSFFRNQGWVPSGSDLHWKRITSPILLEQPIKIVADGQTREVEFRPDGSLKVGCTEVDALTMDKIIERRSKVKK